LIFRHNREWEQNNILASLMFAGGPDGGWLSLLLFRYFIHCDCASAVARQHGEIVLSVDTSWLERYHIDGNIRRMMRRK